jgi:hypothetical protein
MDYFTIKTQLDKILKDYQQAKGREAVSVEELKLYIDEKLIKPKRRGAKSLRGLSL